MDKKALMTKLKHMKLPVMAEQYELQMADPAYGQLSFDERFSELIEMEYASRVNHTIERYIKNAHFYDSSANMEAINYDPERRLDRSQMEELATNNYLEKGLNVIFVGAEVRI
ncbi:ATP-binding protein [uncultured Dubosiella sp.]|uniref:ATP-binding protein n=1 Tax=uncultured Dubosiella sp. TaxID=1937011 RepID=UPI0032B25352